MKKMMTLAVVVAGLLSGCGGAAKQDPGASARIYRHSDSQGPL